MNDFGGRGSARDYRAQETCPRCGARGVYYTGSSVLHGNPYSPAADTEVEHFEECPRCGHSWSYRS
ncbi:MAG: hypothetical protein D6731_10590 [Planctomycetota bacterium]|nr:MAG: hypothetical protein D6731_10590 [Planctomycetota bacterium]